MSFRFGSFVSELLGRPLRVFMSDDERTAIEATFALYEGPLRVLEWGSGGSTVHFSRALPRGSQWTAVEHQRDWAVRVRRELVRRGIDWATVEYVPSETSFKEGIDDGDESTFERYVRICQLGPQRLDAAIVDGRARVACAQRVWPQIADNGFVALHDAQRPEYAAARPIDSSLVRLRDARRQFDGGNVQLDLYFKAPAQARKLAASLSGRLHSAVALSVEEALGG